MGYLKHKARKLKHKLKNLKRFIPKKEAGRGKKILFWVVTVIGGLGLLGILTIAVLFTVISVSLPDVRDLDKLSAAQSTVIYDRNEEPLYTIHGEENREEVSYGEMSEAIIMATVAIEDDNFWNHGGFDVGGITKAFLHEIFGIGRSRGGSTITQQYIKNTFFSTERSYIRKAKEIILATRLEKEFTKEKILELYLNRIPYGNNAYGIQKAAEIYFDKDASKLDLTESVILASLPQAPSYYNPFGENRYSHLVKEFSEEEIADREIDDILDLELDEYRRGLIGSNVQIGSNVIYIPGRTDIAINRLTATGEISEQEKNKVLAELQRIEFVKRRQSINHPHFVFYVRQYLEERYGKDLLEQGGLKVYTTLDPDLQESAEEIVAERAESYPDRFGANNIASLSINAKTGEILSMIGSADYWNEEIDGNVNVVLRARQPGSSFKPLVYLQAFHNGYAPGSVVYDVPMRIGSYRPLNYDGSWGGQMSVRYALAQSRNIPAVKMYYLAEEKDKIIDLVTKMGITTLDKSVNYGAPLALGSGEVPLIEMVTAYGTMANGGKKPELTSILRVENNNGDVLEEWEQPEFEEVVDPQLVYLINDILSDKESGLGPNTFVNGKTNAVKTGTSTKSSKSDGGVVLPGNTWTIGYTPTIVTGVWVGNTDGTGLNLSANGYDTAAPIFKEIMTAALKDQPNEPFPRPQGIETVQISKASGLLPGPNTPADFIVEDIFPDFAKPTEEEDVFFEVEIDEVSGKLPTEYTPKETIISVIYQKYEPIADKFNWAEEIVKYFEENPPEPKEGEEPKGNVRFGAPPTEYDDVHTPEAQERAPTVNIISPAGNSNFEAGEWFDIRISFSAQNGLKEINYYRNDDLQFSPVNGNSEGRMRLPTTAKKGDTYVIKAEIIDQLGYASYHNIKLRVGKSDQPDPEPEEPEEEEEEEEPQEEPEPQNDPLEEPATPPEEEEESDPNN